MSSNPKLKFALEATIKQIDPIQTIGKFTKRDLILNDMFGNDIAMEAIFDTAKHLDAIALGTKVKVEFSIKSNYWAGNASKPGRYFTAVIAESVQPIATAPVATAPVASPQAATVAAPVAAPVGMTQPPVQAGGDQIPF